jgi:hypothetical protein
VLPLTRIRGELLLRENYALNTICRPVEARKRVAAHVNVIIDDVKVSGMAEGTSG